MSVRRLTDWRDETLRELADRHGTPLYVLDLERVAANLDRLQSAFPDATVLYACKANALRDVLETVLDAGAGLECASGGEVVRAIAAGAPGEDIHYTPVNPPATDLETVIECWHDEPELTVTVGSADTVDRLLERGYDGQLCLRVTPDIGAGHHEAVRTGADAAFGVPIDRAVSVIEDADARGLDVVGIHGHLGSGITNDDLATHRVFVERLGELATRVEREVTDLVFVDVGGGFGVPYRPSEAPLDLEAVAAATRGALSGVDAELVIEPGRYVVADAGVLVTSVTSVKETPSGTVAGVDAGMTTLVRPALYDAYHPIRSLVPDATERPATSTTVAGPVCESADVLGTGRELPAPARGDFLAVGMTGAYGYEMASHYTTRPRPATVVLEGGSDRIARRRETIEDVVRPEEVPR